MSQYFQNISSQAVEWEKCLRFYQNEGQNLIAETQKYLKYFSINPQGMKLCILVSEENYVWDYDNITPNRAIDDSGTKDPAGVELLPDDYATATRVESTFKIKEYEYEKFLYVICFSIVLHSYVRAVYSCRIIRCAFKSAE